MRTYRNVRIENGTRLHVGGYGFRMTKADDGSAKLEYPPVVSPRFVDSPTPTDTLVARYGEVYRFDKPVLELQFIVPGASYGYYNIDILENTKDSLGVITETAETGDIVEIVEWEYVWSSIVNLYANPMYVEFTKPAGAVRCGFLFGWQRAGAWAAQFSMGYRSASIVNHVETRGVTVGISNDPWGNALLPNIAHLGYYGGVSSTFVWNCPYIVPDGIVMKYYGTAIPSNTTVGDRIVNRLIWTR